MPSKEEGIYTFEEFKEDQLKQLDKMVEQNQKDGLYEGKESIVGKRVIARFQDGDDIVLTVESEGPELYYFKEKKLASWWYKKLCEPIADEPEYTEADIKVKNSDYVQDKISFIDWLFQRPWVNNSPSELYKEYRDSLSITSAPQPIQRTCTEEEVKELASGYWDTPEGEKHLAEMTTPQRTYTEEEIKKLKDDPFIAKHLKIIKEKTEYYKAMNAHLLAQQYADDHYDQFDTPEERMVLEIGFVAGFKKRQSKLAEANTLIDHITDALQDLIDAVPKQTNDCDWWEDSLVKAVDNAATAIAKAEAFIKTTK